MATANTRKLNTWQQALKKFNEGNTNWLIPKKDTAQYAKVKKIQKKLTKNAQMEKSSAEVVAPVEKVVSKKKKNKSKKPVEKTPESSGMDTDSDME